MKKKLILSLLLFTILLGPARTMAQSGCPPEPLSGAGLPYEVLEAIQLAPATPESHSPQGQAQGAFRQVTQTVSWQPGQRVYLAASPDGADLCVDDYFELRNITSGQIAKHDFRDRAVSRILSTSLVDLTYLFAVGPNVLELTLIDLTGPAYSSSPLFILKVAAPATPTPTFSPTATPSPTPTLTPTAIPTRTPTPTVPPSPTSTNTLTAVVAVVEPAEPPFEGEAGEGNPSSPMALIFLGLVSLLVAVSVYRWWARSRRLLPLGQVELYNGGQYIATNDLPFFGKEVLSIGKSAQADIVIADQRVPDLAARIRTRQEGQTQQTILEILDPDDPQTVLETHPLAHGDGHIFGTFKLVYLHYQPEPSFFEGDLTHV